MHTVCGAYVVCCWAFLFFLFRLIGHRHFTERTHERINDSFVSVSKLVEIANIKIDDKTRQPALHTSGNWFDFSMNIGAYE